MQDPIESALETIWELLEEQTNVEIRASKYDGQKKTRSFLASGWMEEKAFSYGNRCSVIHQGTIYTYEPGSRNVEPVGKGNSFCIRDLLPHGAYKMITQADPKEVSFRDGVVTVHDGNEHVSIELRGRFIASVSVCTVEQEYVAPNCYAPIPHDTTYEFTKAKPGSHRLTATEINAFRARGVMI